MAHGHPDLKRGDASAVYEVRDELARALTKYADHRLRAFRVVASARTPVLKLVADLDDGTVAVDLSLGEPANAVNSRLVGAYPASSPAARALFVLVKRWTAARELATVYKQRMPSPYAHACLVITYLRAAGYAGDLQPPSLEPRARLDGLDVTFARAAPAREATDDVPALLAAYFAWLAALEGGAVVASPRLGAVAPRDGHWLGASLAAASLAADLRSGNFDPGWPRLSIEDPFEHAESPRPRDLGDVLSEASQRRFFAEARRAARAADDRDYEALFRPSRSPSGAFEGENLACATPDCGARGGLYLDVADGLLYCAGCWEAVLCAYDAARDGPAAEEGGDAEPAPRREA